MKFPGTNSMTLSEDAIKAAVADYKKKHGE